MESELKCLWCEEIVQNKIELHIHAQNHYKEAMMDGHHLNSNLT
jgi:hypothetical protein